MTIGEANGIAATLVRLQENQRIKIKSVADAIMAAYRHGMADGHKTSTPLGLNSQLDQGDQA